MTALARAAHAEWTRVWTVRSSWVLVLLTAVVVVGFASLVGHSEAQSAQASAGSTAWDGGRSTGMFALFGILALGVVTATADHATGAIVPTLQWTPRRRVLLAARTGVLVATATAVGLALVTVASLTVLAFVPRLGLPVGDGLETLGDLTVVLGCGAALAVGLGLALRSTAGALVAVLALVLVLPLFVPQLPHDWAVTIAAHLPGAGALFLVVGEGPSDDMTVASARLTLLVWGAGAVVAGGARLLRSDADR